MDPHDTLRVALIRLRDTFGRAGSRRSDVSRGVPGLSATLRQYRLVDFFTQGYLALVGLLMLVFHGGRVPGWAWLATSHLVCLLVVHGIIAWHSTGRGGRVLDFFRSYYPILLYTGFYRETGLLNQMFHAGYADVLFMRADYVLFGCQPSLTWMEHWPSRWFAEVMYGCYFSYYLMIAGIGLTLLIRNRRQFDHFVSVVSFVFYVCYLTYIFLPVMGPRIFFGADAAAFFGPGNMGHLPPELVPMRVPDFPGSVQDGFFYGIVIWIYHHFEAPGAAFPSSHVAIALATAYFSWTYLPRIRWIHVALAFGLCLSTVYCRYHYVVDVLAGVAMAAAFVPLANHLYRRWDQEAWQGRPYSR